MWENENVLSYATRIQEISAEILDCHKQNNNGKEAAEFERNLKRTAIDCFLRGLKPELEIRIGRADNIHYSKKLKNHHIIQNLQKQMK